MYWNFKLTVECLQFKISVHLAERIEFGFRLHCGQRDAPHKNNKCINISGFWDVMPPILVGNAYSITIVLSTWPICKWDLADSFPTLVQIYWTPQRHIQDESEYDTHRFQSPQFPDMSCMVKNGKISLYEIIYPYLSVTVISIVTPMKMSLVAWKSKILYEGKLFLNWYS